MPIADLITIILLAGVSVALFFWLWPRGRLEVARTGPQIVVDGTNVLFWRDEVAQIATLRTVVNRLTRTGFAPMVFLDASSRHHLGDRSLDAERFAQALGLPTSRVMVCPARTEADAFILQYASERNIAVVSNDRFRDRPREARNIRLVKGRFEGERLILKGL